MAFTLPNFNIAFDVWAPGNVPDSDPPDFLVIGQLYFWSHTTYTAEGGLVWYSEFIRAPIVSVEFILPVVGTIWGWTDPGGFTWYYLARWWAHTHGGFSNEYASVNVQQCTSLGTTPDTSR